MKKKASSRGAVVEDQKVQEKEYLDAC